MGRGDERSADQAAVDAMRQALNVLGIDGTVVIGEGERDEAPMLYIGERVGSGNGPRVDIALDPLEGTITTGGPNAIACLAIAGEGGFLNAPDTYMDKIAVGGGLPEGVVHIEASPAENLKNLAEAKDVQMSDLVVLILDRPRHQDLIAAVRQAGARIRLIRDGDVAGVIATARRTAASTSTWASAARPRASSPRRRCARSAARCRASCISATTTRARAEGMGITDLDRVYDLHDLAGAT